MSEKLLNSLINTELVDSKYNYNLNSEIVPEFNYQNIIKPQLISIQHEPIVKPLLDGNYILINRSIKFLLNFLLTFLFIKFIIGNWPDLSINQFVLLVCTVTSVLLYILDLTYPSCSI